MKKKHGKVVRLITLKIEDVLPHLASRPGRVKNHTVVLSGYLVRRRSTRLGTFKRNGITCIACKIKGKFFAIEQDEKIEIPFINLYAIDKEGDEVLMTSDHIIPISKGGSNGLANRQTMCKICNEKKGNTYED